MHKKKTVAAAIIGIAIIGVAVVGLAVVGSIYKKDPNKYLQKQKNNGSTIYTTTFEDAKAIYKNSVSEDIEEELVRTAKNKTFDKPLWAYNPFGTNECAFYLAFYTKEEAYIKYTISVGKDNIEDFTRVLNIGDGKKVTKDHAYSVVGFVPGYENTVTLQMYNEQDELLKESKTTFNVPEVFDQESVLISYKDGDSTEELTEGLFTAFAWGTDDSRSKGTLLYDNNGTMRSRFPQIMRYGARIDQIGEDYLYIISKAKLALVSPTGKVKKVYTFADYSYHHDFKYVEEQGKILVLVNDEAEDATTVEDLVIAIDVESGEVTRLIDFKDLFPDQYKKAVEYKKAGVQGEGIEDPEKLDWIHINSLDMVDEDSMIFSGRELSEIIKVDDVWNHPAVDYVIADDIFVDGTSEKDLQLKQAGDKVFAPQYGQHNVVVEKEDTQTADSYYITLFNNNRGTSSTRPDIDYSKLKNVGVQAMKPEEGINSYYYKYFIDEKNKTYQLVESFEVPYSGIVSNVQPIGDNFAICSGAVNILGEYDKNGKLIRQYSLENKPLTYRIQKNTFNNIWFQEK